MFETEIHTSYVEDELKAKGIWVEIYTNPMWVRPQIEINTYKHDKELLMGLLATMEERNADKSNTSENMADKGYELAIFHLKAEISKLLYSH